MLLAVSDGLDGVDGLDSFLQLCTVLVLFVVVLAITWAATKWIANVQGGMNAKGRNIEVVETYRLSANKYIQMIRVGEKYVAVAVCKDTVTVLAEIPAGEVQIPDQPGGAMPDFKKVLEKVRRKDDNRKNEE